MKKLTIVIKLGSSSIVDENTHEPLLPIVSLIVTTAVKLHNDGHKVVIVSSGAIAVGLRRMDIDRRPKHLPKVQALAAIGQCRLMSLWDQLFGHMRQPVAQVLLTRNDMADRTQYQNAQNTLRQLLDMGVIPIVNENDTLAVSEIKFGDNDTLSAITAAMVHADYLFLMTDVDCLYDKNPRKYADAKPVEVVKDVADLQVDVSSAGSSLGTGGMGTKLVAARLATSAGVTTVIAKSDRPGNIRKIVHYVESQKPKSSKPEKAEKAALVNGTNGTHSAASSIPSSPALEPINDTPLHTRFLPNTRPIRDRYFWLLHGVAPQGNLYIDDGAYKALADGAGLLPVGVVDVEGSFAQQDAVRIFVAKRKDVPAHVKPRSHPNSPRLVPTVVEAKGETPRSRSPKGSPKGSPKQKAVEMTPICPYELENPAPIEVGRAVVNYSSAEIFRIMGLQTRDISEALGYADSEHVALRENIAFYDATRTLTVMTTEPLTNGNSNAEAGSEPI